jgi:filamentous hemagglutinin
MEYTMTDTPMLERTLPGPSRNRRLSDKLISLVAGNDYRQVGSDILAPGGDIGILAKSVTIEEARETFRSTYETKAKQSGLTIALTSPVISAIQTGHEMLKVADDTGDGRMQALALASTGLAGYQGVQAIETGGQPKPVYNDNGEQTGTRDATADEQAGGINLSFSLGSSQSQSKQSWSADGAVGSTIAAGGDIAIVATGAGEDSDLTIQGSQITAGNNLALIAEDEIKLLAARNTAHQESSNQSSSASVGFSIGTDGLLFNVGASQGKGQADGDDLVWTNTHVNAGNILTLQSGGDTTLRGAVAGGNQIIADIGGNLLIESLQDKSTYESEQKSAGVSLSIGYGKIGGSLSYSQSEIESDYASVVEQSGLLAGDGGFDVEVKGNTDLIGGVIASTQAAIDENKNSFTTASLTTSDLQNRAEYEAEAIGIHLGSGMSFDGQFVPGGTGAGRGKDSDEAESVTRSGISEALVTIGGQTTDTTITALTDSAGNVLNTDVRTGDPQTGIDKIFDAEKVQKEIDAQVKITQTFGQQATKLVRDYAKTKTDPYLAAYNKKLALERERGRTSIADMSEEEAAAWIADYQSRIDEQEKIMSIYQAEYDLWREGGTHRMAADILIATLGLGQSGLVSSIVQETLLSMAYERHMDTIKDSQGFPGYCETSANGQCINNATGESTGAFGILFNTTGGRLPTPEVMCGGTGDDSNCQGDDEEGTYKIDKLGRILLKESFSFAQLIKNVSPLGGIQGMSPNSVFGISYAPGSLTDYVTSLFGGAHDYANKSYWYDAQGNVKDLDGAEKTFGEVYNGLNVLRVTPFALSQLPPELLNVLIPLLGK